LDRHRKLDIAEPHGIRANLDVPNGRASKLGSRNPDRIRITMRRRKCETVAQMHAAGWDVISKCQACGLIMRVNLKLNAKVSGPSTSLWNRKERCRRLGCTGFVEFQVRASDVGWLETLSAPWPDAST
jgi:hypothetical protein